MFLICAQLLMPFPTKNKSYLEFGYSSFPEDGVAVNPTWIT